MRKFFILLKKEIQELLTPQMLVPLVIVVLVFVFIGKVVGREAAKNNVSQPLAVMDLDKSAFSEKIIEVLGQNNFTVNMILGDPSQLVEKTRQANQKAALLIPAGFEEGIKNGVPQEVKVYNVLSNFSFVGSRTSQILKGALLVVNENLSAQLIAQKTSGADAAFIKQPLRMNDFVVIGDKQANISPDVVAGFIASQTTFIPIVLFMVIIFAAQLITTSIASEKENKTLETLLSSPVSRRSIVAAKLTGAGIVSLLTAGVYVFGMRYYMNGITGVSSAGGAGDAVTSAVGQLGLVLGVSDYLMLGLSLFLGILAALSVAFILGSFAQDVKSAQGLLSPLMILIMVPYFLTLFLDISSLSPAMKILVYAIPFTHPFLAAPGLLMGQYINVWLGIAYMAFFFVVFVAIAAKLFSSEKIFTMKLNLKKKRIFSQ